MEADSWIVRMKSRLPSRAYREQLPLEFCPMARRNIAGASFFSMSMPLLSLSCSLLGCWLVHSPVSSRVGQIALSPCHRANIRQALASWMDGGQARIGFPPMGMGSPVPELGSVHPLVRFLSTVLCLSTPPVADPSGTILVLQHRVQALGSEAKQPWSTYRHLLFLGV